MKKIVFLALLGVAAWQASKHWDALFERTPSHEAAIRNESGRTIVRLRLTVDGRTFVRERIGPDTTSVIPFRVAHDSRISLLWEWADAVSELRWSGGSVAAGPLVQRHLIAIHRDGSVVYLPEALPAR